MTTLDDDETEPVDGVTVGKTRRVVFTALAIVAFVFAVQGAYHWIHGLWGQRLDSGFPMYASYFREKLWWFQSWIVIPSLAAFPTLLLAISEHNSARKAIRDLDLLLAVVLIAGSIASALLLGDQNGMPVDNWEDWFELIELHGGRDGAWEARGNSRWWLLIPITLTIAFIIASARRRAIRDAGRLEAGEEE